MGRGQRTTGTLGALAERRALGFLERRGLRLVCRNFRCRSGEIDLIMRDAGHLVFVEVRYRASTAFLSPAQTVDAGKQRRIVRAASMFLAGLRGPQPAATRFDVIAVVGAGRVEWLRDAFRPEDSSL